MKAITSHLWLLWLIPAPTMAYFFVRFVQTRRFYIYKPTGRIPRADPFIVFQFASKEAPPVVTEAVRRIHSACRVLDYTNYLVEVVTDNPAADIAGAQMVVVPSDYRPPRGCKYKAKSLQYALERRIRSAQVRSDIWIFLLDEESFVNAQTVEAVLNYLADANPKPIAEGPITYPHGFFQANLLCSIMECLRPYICYDCVALMLTIGPTHLHGSNLLVRADVEAAVGWDHRGVDASEDQRFALEARLRFREHAFGWHGGVLEEQPALKIQDAIRQRQRWFVGNVHNMMYCPIPWSLKAAVMIRWATWGLGFIAGLVSILVLAIPQDIPWAIRAPLVINSVLWLFGYQVGAYFNFQPYAFSFWKRVRWHLIVLLLSPVAGLIDSWSAFTAPLHIRGFTRVPTPKMDLGSVLEPAIGSEVSY